MAVQDDEFLTRLLATFREEAADHLQAIISGVLALEKNSTCTQSVEIEPVYRATHSLKGAARAVGLKDIESVCQHLESVFSAVRKGDFILQSEEFDLVHQVISTLEALLAGDTVVKAGPLIYKLKQIVPISGASQKSGTTSIQISDSSHHQHAQIPKQAEYLSQPLPLSSAIHPEQADVIKETQIKHDKSDKLCEDFPSELRSQFVPSSTQASTTVRISEERLRSLYEVTDDLLSYRLSSGVRLSDLKEIAQIIRTWRWNMNRIEGDVSHLKRQILDNQDSIERLVSFIDVTRDLIGSCETKLDSTIKSMIQDQYEMDSVITGLIENIREVVLTPFSTLSDSYPRMIRDIAREQNKQVNLSISGSDIEIDRRILEIIKDPMIHILRNAVDHGIEPADLRVSMHKPPGGEISIEIVHNRANQITITVGDDGQGINTDAASEAAVEKGFITHEEAERMPSDQKALLVFRSGFSTSKTVSTVSGRGLGLAIVQEKVNQIGGSIDIKTIPGKGTTFSLNIPVTLSTFRGLLVYVENRPFFFPLDQVERVLIPDADDISTIEGRTVIQFEGQLIPVVMLNSILQLPSGSAEPEDARSFVLINNQGKVFGLIVSQICGAQEIVVRGLGPQLKEVRFISGVAILNNNTVVPVLQVDDLVQAMQGVDTTVGMKNDLSSSLSGRQKIMVVEDSITSRMLLKNILEGSGYEVETAVDGLDAFTKLKTTQVDLVVSDVDMPRMSGFVLTEKIRSEKNLVDLPVILVTSLDSREDREHGITVGANAYIIKSSFDQSNLLDVIKRLIGAGR